MLSLTSLEMLFQSSHPNCSPWLSLLASNVNPGMSCFHAAFTAA